MQIEQKLARKMMMRINVAQDKAFDLCNMSGPIEDDGEANITRNASQQIHSLDVEKGGDVLCQSRARGRLMLEKRSKLVCFVKRNSREADRSQTFESLNSRLTLLSEKHGEKLRMSLFHILHK